MDQRYIERHQLPKKNFTEANIKSFYKLLVGIYFMLNAKRDVNGVRVMEFNATFNNILAISFWSVLLLEDTGVPG